MQLNIATKKPKRHKTLCESRFFWRLLLCCAALQWRGIFEVFTSHECRSIRLPHSDQAPPSCRVDEFKGPFDRVALLEHERHWATLGIEGIRNCRIGFDARVRWIRRDNLRFFQLRSIRPSEFRRWWRLQRIADCLCGLFGCCRLRGLLIFVSSNGSRVLRFADECTGNSVNRFGAPPNQDNQSDQASNTQDEKERPRASFSYLRIHGHHLSAVPGAFP
jgi:hypothetical protein